MIRSAAFLILISIMMAVDSPAQKPALSISWKKVAVVPTSGNNQKSLGMAGAINGVNNDVFVVAGGSNFPDKLPWEGGKKAYYDNIFVLEKKGNKYEWNKNVKSTLPEPIAYCGITSTPMGIVYAGGENMNGISAKTFILTWSAAKNEINTRPLPNLPVALTNVALTHLGNMVYAAGGDGANHSSKRFFSLNIDDKNAKWESLPDLPIALANAALIAQSGSDGENIYLIGGRSKTPSGISDLHHTVFVFDVKKNEWRKGADISDGKNISNLSAAAGVAIDKNYILVVGGDNGETFHKIETYISQISKADSPEEKEKLTKEKNALSIHHKGFYKGLLLYDTKHSKWTNIGDYPFPAQVTTNGVKWGNDIVVSNGEIKPGVRTPDVVVGKIIRNEK